MEGVASGEASVSGDGKKLVEAVMDGTRLVARPGADLARDAVPAFREEMLKLIGEFKPESVTVDFAQVSFLGSAALGVLVEMMKVMGKSHRIDVMNMSASIRTMFEIARLSTLFPIRASGEG